MHNQRFAVTLVMFALAVSSVVFGTVGQGSPAQAGVKKLAKHGKKTASKASSKVTNATKKAAKSTKKAATKTAQETAEKAKEAVTGAFASALNKVLDGLKPSGKEPELPALSANMFDRFVPKSSFLWSNAYLISLAAKLTYNSQPIAQSALAKLGLAKVSWLGVEGTQVYVASNDKLVVVAFRGTQFTSPRDILTDVKMTAAQGYGGRVHFGAHRAVAQVIDQVVSALKTHNPSRDKAVWLTGHSLGGSLAALAAVYLNSLGLPVQGLYTLGQFRVGNESFARGFTLPLYRIVNENDPVGYAPIVADLEVLKSIAFRHAGQLVFFNTKGKLEKGRKGLPRFSAELVFWILRNGFPTPHDMGVYLNRIWNHLPASLRKVWPKPY